MIKKLLLIIIIAGTYSILFSPSYCSSNKAGDAVVQGGNNSGKPVELTNPIGATAPEVIIGNVIKQVLGVVGSLALVMFIYGGIVWMTSAGSSEKVEKGKNIIVWAVIGLVVIFSSYALVKFVIQTAAGT